MWSIITRVQVALARVFDEEEGQGLTEYALILALIAVIAIAALTARRQGIRRPLEWLAASAYCPPFGSRKRPNRVSFMSNRHVALAASGSYQVRVGETPNVCSLR